MVRISLPKQFKQNIQLFSPPKQLHNPSDKIYNSEVSKLQVDKSRTKKQLIKRKQYKLNKLQKQQAAEARKLRSPKDQIEPLKSIFISKAITKAPKEAENFP